MQKSSKQERNLPVQNVDSAVPNHQEMTIPPQQLSELLPADEDEERTISTRQQESDSPAVVGMHQFYNCTFHV